MTTDALLPDWPPPPNEPIGEDRARAYIAWIRQQAPPLIADARRQIHARYPGVRTWTSAVSIDQLAAWTLSERMSRLNIGVVSAGIGGGTFAMVDIDLRRDGRLEARPGWNMRT